MEHRVCNSQWRRAFVTASGVCVYVCVCVYGYVHLYPYVLVSAYMCVRVHVLAYVYAYVWVSVCVSVPVDVCLLMYAYAVVRICSSAHVSLSSSQPDVAHHPCDRSCWYTLRSRWRAKLQPLARLAAAGGAPWRGATFPLITQRPT